jgi:hypothetical protein
MTSKLKFGFQKPRYCGVQTLVWKNKRFYTFIEMWSCQIIQFLKNCELLSCASKRATGAAKP